MATLVSYLFITQNRKQDLCEAIESVQQQDYDQLEIVVVDNASTDGTDRLVKEELNRPNIRYVQLPENLGVSGGRNVAIEAAQGDILITLDDDALIEPREATRKIVERFSGETELGALAFRVVNHSTNELDLNYFPWRDKRRNPNEEFETSYFLGVGHAIPRDVYKKVGLYADYFPYGHEEGDLSIRIIDAGFRIFYLPDVTIRHKLQVGRRRKLSGKWPILLENRIKVAIRNLPAQYVLSWAIVWTLRTLWDCRGNPGPVVKAWSQLWRKRKQLANERKPIRKQTIRRLRELKGLLFY